MASSLKTPWNVFKLNVQEGILVVPPIQLIMSYHMKLGTLSRKSEIDQQRYNKSYQDVYRKQVRE